MADKTRSDAQERPHFTAERVARALVVMEKRRLERLAQAHGVSRKTAAQLANAFFADALPKRP
ncbi:hypothetical protein [Comamonas antarctica]|uniref:hypothetical protein n=1 Tax=Comamonas antarctica TaxID=2743470 RepID=UPI0028E3935D|nr:hypothetical protein [Comamonas antarctica]